MRNKCAERERENKVKEARKEWTRKITRRIQLIELDTRCSHLQCCVIKRKRRRKFIFLLLPLTPPPLIFSILRFLRERKRASYIEYKNVNNKETGSKSELCEMLNCVLSVFVFSLPLNLLQCSQCLPTIRKSHSLWWGVILRLNLSHIIRWNFIGKT